MLWDEAFVRKHQDDLVAIGLVICGLCGEDRGRNPLLETTLRSDLSALPSMLLRKLRLLQHSPREDVLILKIGEIDDLIGEWRQSQDEVMLTHREDLIRVALAALSICGSKDRIPQDILRVAQDEMLLLPAVLMQDLRQLEYANDLSLNEVSVDSLVTEWRSVVRDALSDRFGRDRGF